MERFGSTDSVASLGRTRNPLELSDSLRRRAPNTHPDPPKVVHDAAGNRVFDGNIDPPSFIGSGRDARWRQEKDLRKNVTCKNKFLALLVDEIQKSSNGEGRPRHKGRFFNIVRGGNVNLVKEVLKTLKDIGLQRELDWVLGTTHDDHPTTASCSAHIRHLHVVMVTICAVLFFLLTPFFYLLQVVIRRAHSVLRSRISDVIDLPLVFAVLSEDPAMVKLFLDAGCPLHGHDSRGNNLYHYLADISVDDPDKAVRCHGVMCDSISNVRDLNSLITEQTNLMEMTALESIAKYGSPHFLRYIMVDKSCVGNLRLGVSKTKLFVDDANAVFDVNHEEAPSDEPTSGHETCLNIWEFDISRYERGDTFGKQSYLLQLVAGRSVEGMSKTDIWGLVKSKLLEKWFAIKFKQYMAFSLLGHALYMVITVLLLGFVIFHGGDVDSTPLYGTFISYEFRELSRAGHQVRQHDNTTTQNDTSVRAAGWNDTCRGWDVTWRDEIIDVIESNDGAKIDNCTASALKSLRTACHGVDTSFILSQTLNRSENDQMESSPVRKALDYMILFHVILDIVVKEAFLFATYNVNSASLLYGVAPVLLRRLPGSYTEKILSYLMYTFYGSYLFSNHLWYAARYKRNFAYHRFLANLETYSASELESISGVLAAAAAEVDGHASFTGNLVIICLMLRFLHSIHALRLLPGVGFFVITTKKMAKHLFQFTIVFSMVSLAFATIFYFVMRDASCPRHKVQGFRGLFTSLFSTYQVALGYGEYDFTININAMVGFVTYTIISVILLLNLVIAVMTTTVDQLTQMPWREALVRVERWDEILGTEVTVRTVCVPVRAGWRALAAVFGRMAGPAVWRDIRVKTRRTFEVIYYQ